MLDMSDNEFPREIVASVRRRDMNGRFILIGLRKFSLMQGVSESMAGRCGVLEL